MKRLSKGPIEVNDADDALKELVKLQYVEKTDARHTIAVPMFATWIEENK